MTTKRSAFTLVELLVVIGIIALLISILLPSLNRARQQANLVSCQSHLRQIGQVLAIYESESQGRLPFGDVQNETPPPPIKETDWWWVFTLGDMLNKGMVSSSDGLVHNLNKVFTDVDTIDGHDFRWVSHYTANVRLFYWSGMPVSYTAGGDPTDLFGNDITTNRKVGDVRNSANVFAIWDAPQSSGDGQNYNAYPLPEAIDAWAWYNNGMAFGVNTPNPNLAAWPSSVGGTPGASDGKAAQKKDNIDPPGVWDAKVAWAYLRFRHMNNTELNALCLDGHVETRYVGTVTRNDLYTNAPGTH